MSSNDGILLSHLPSPPSSITVGNDQSIPIHSRGTSVIQIADRPFHLDNVLVALQLTRNLLSVRQLTTITVRLSLTPLVFLLRICRPRRSSFGAIAMGISTPFHTTCHLAAMSPSSPRSYGTPALVILHPPSSPLSISYQLSSVIKQLATFVMPANLASTLGCHSLVRFLVHQLPLNLFTVMSGPLQF